MDDAEIVATIAVGELDGLAAALDRYAVSLFDYCYTLAPEAAVDAVHDTFIIAWCKLDGLRDPRGLYSWLETVAANECFRRTLTDGGPEQQPADTPPPAVMPPGLPGRVLNECADETPAGRALKVWVTNRAGPFGRDGFPAANLGRRGDMTGRRRLAVTAAAAVVLAVAGTSIALLVSAGSPRPDTASATGPGTGTGPSGTAATPGASLPTTPASPIAPATSSASRGMPHASASLGTVQHGAMGPGVSTGHGQSSPPAVMAATMPPSAAAPPPSTQPPAQGTLAASPPQLVLVAGAGAAAKTFTLTAQNGPVGGYTIDVPPGLPGTLTVSASSGSLAAGGSVAVTVSASSAVPFTTDLTIYPGGIAVQVTVKVHKGGDG